MFLSDKARALYDSGKHLDLQRLPFEELVDAGSVNALLQEENVTDSPRDASSPVIAKDVASLSTLHDPVVISSGQIYSRETVNQIISHCPRGVLPKCPITREIIDEQRVVALPQITYAIALWKFKKELPLPSNRLPLFTTLKVANNKIRIEINGPHQQFEALLRHVFFGKNNNPTVLPGESYCAPAWSFAWAAENGMTKLEIWFQQGWLKNSEVEKFVNEMLRSLGEEFDKSLPIPDSIFVDTMEARKYATAVSLELPDYEKVARCCIDFIAFGSAYRKSESGLTDFEDAVTMRSRLASKSNDLGLKLFSTSPPRGQSQHHIITSSSSYTS